MSAKKPFVFPPHTIHINDLSKIDLAKLDYFTVGIRRNKTLDTSEKIYFSADNDAPLIYPDVSGGQHNWYKSLENQDEYYLGFSGGYAFLCIFDNFAGWLVNVRDNPTAPTYKNHANWSAGYPNVPARKGADPLGEVNFKNSVAKREGLQELCIFDTERGLAIAPSSLISNDFGHEEFQEAFDEMRVMAHAASGIDIPKEYLGVRSQELPLAGEKIGVLSWELEMTMYSQKALFVDERKYGANNLNIVKTHIIVLPGKVQRYIIIDAEKHTLTGQPCDSAIGFFEADEGYAPKLPLHYSHLHKSGKPYNPDPESSFGKTLNNPLLCPMVNAVFNALP